MVETNMGTLPNYPRSIFLPSKCSRSKIVLLGHVRSASCCFKWRLYHHFGFQVALPPVKGTRQSGWSIGSRADGSSPDPPGSGTDSKTRLVRAIQTFLIKLNARYQELKKGLPMKVLFFLVGFYCATAFSTVIGQTGDWDILSAGLAVVVVEGIGALMYRASIPLLGRLRSLITMFNYWKAGLSLGLFLDAFKYEMDIIFESCNPFSIEIDFFPLFW